MCIGVGAPDGGQRRERPLNGDQVGDEMQHSASPDRHLRGLSRPLATPAAPKVAPVTGSANVP